MLDSTFALVGFFFLMALILLFVNPLLALIPLSLVVVPFALKAISGLFRHAAPPTGADESPAVPTTSEASYEPVADPGSRD